MTALDPAFTLALIHQCAVQTLAQQPALPCRVEEMTPREYQIYRALSAALASLQSIASWGPPLTDAMASEART